MKDDSQTKELTYTVNHVIGTTVKDTKTYREKVWVNAPDTIKIVKGSLDQKTYTGYKFDSMNPAEVGTTIASGSTITLTYVKDDSQTKELTYTVNHVIGTTVKDTKTYREKVWVNAPDTIKIVKGSLDQKTYTGYKFDSMNPAEVGTTIASLQVLKKPQNTLERIFSCLAHCPM